MPEVENGESIRTRGLDEPAALRASRRSSGVKGIKLGSIGCRVRRCRLICLDSLVLVEEQEVNCLQKAEAMAFLEDRVLLLKVMNWFGECVDFLPERERSKDQKRAELYLRLQPSTRSVHALRVSAAMDLETSSSKSRTRGEDGSSRLWASRSTMRAAVPAETPGL